MCDGCSSLWQEKFDTVVWGCELEGSEESGQDLLDELQRWRLLPHSMVFLMVTSQAVYLGAPDGLLLRGTAQEETAHAGA